MSSNRIEIVQTKCLPPRIKPHTIRRKRLDDIFLQVVDYPVTIVQAEAGYGKSTTLVTHLCPKFDSLIWYSVDESDRDALLFLTYLIHACKSVHPVIGDRSLLVLHEDAFTTARIQPCLTYLLNDLTELAPDPTLLVFDDIHTVIDIPEIRTMLDFMLRYLPIQIHVVFGSRKEVDTPILRRFTMASDVLIFDKTDLAFTEEEIRQFFLLCYDIELNTEQLGLIWEQTEGWAIALLVVAKWMERKKDPWIPQIEKQMDRNGIFPYIAEEVYDRLPPDIQVFLAHTSILQTVEPEICDQLLGSTDSAEKLENLEKNGLFVNEVGMKQYRYHRLFQEFLKQYSANVVNVSDWKDLHFKAAQIYEQQGQMDRCLMHIRDMQDTEILLSYLLAYGESLLQNGRLELLKQLIENMSSTHLEQYPILVFWRGEIERALSRYEEAVHWYTLAEGGYITNADAVGRSRVYCGHAQLYLDTIQPNKAVIWLQKAVSVLGDHNPKEQARILRLLSENFTNAGQLQEAGVTLDRSYQLTNQVSRDELDIRILLRSGRLVEARNLTVELLNQQALGKQKGRNRMARSHREMHLLLSLIDAFLGDIHSSKQHAQKGIDIGKELNSPFVEAIGLMRLGHAYSLEENYTRAIDVYTKSIERSEQLKVDRGKVEALMGLCMTAGLTGDLDRANQYAKEGLTLALSVQDVWCANLVRLAIGSIWISFGHIEEGLTWMEEAANDFETCGDRYLLSNARLWLCIGYHRLDMKKKLQEQANAFLDQVNREETYSLLRRRTLFGPKDPLLVVPFLLFARDEWNHPTAAQLLIEFGLGSMNKHPGCTLRVFTLGSFEVYRGFDRVERKEWRRDKSRQLFQLLVTRIGQWIQREEIIELLWQDTDEESAIRDFKVALHALTNAIELEREARSESFYIERKDSSYRLVANQSIWVDAHEFQREVDRCLLSIEQIKKHGNGDPRQVQPFKEQLETIMSLYRGEYLQQELYLDFCNGMREQLRVTYIRCLEMLARLSQELMDWRDAVHYAECILEQDPTWEEAYRIAMLGYHKLKQRNLVVATYKACLIQLEEQFRLTPSKETIELYQRLTRS